MEEGMREGKKIFMATPVTQQCFIILLKQNNIFAEQLHHRAGKFS